MLRSAGAPASTDRCILGGGIVSYQSPGTESLQVIEVGISAHETYSGMERNTEIFHVPRLGWLYSDLLLGALEIKSRVLKLSGLETSCLPRNCMGDEYGCSHFPAGSLFHMNHGVHLLAQ